jgi:hypothetical protein
VNFICATCGTHFAESEQPPVACPICEDERLYVGLDGQTWTTLEELRHVQPCPQRPGILFIN